VKVGTQSDQIRTGLINHSGYLEEVADEIKLRSYSLSLAITASHTSLHRLLASYTQFTANRIGSAKKAHAHTLSHTRTHTPSSSRCACLALTLPHFIFHRLSINLLSFNHTIPPNQRQSPHPLPPHTWPHQLLNHQHSYPTSSYNSKSIFASESIEGGTLNPSSAIIQSTSTRVVSNISTLLRISL